MSTKRRIIYLSFILALSQFTTKVLLGKHTSKSKEQGFRKQNNEFLCFSLIICDLY